MYIVDAVLDPMGIIWLLLICRIVVGMLRGWSSKFSCFLVLLLLLISSPFIVNNMLYLFEKQNESMSCADQADLPIVVLGGGLDDRAVSSSDYHYLSLASMARVMRAVELAKQSPEAKVYLSGGKSGTMAEGVVMHSYFSAMGVPATQMVIEDRSVDTRQNAIHTSQLLDADGEGVRLVTSAVHLPRAQAAFIKAGVSVCPVAADYLGNRSIPIYALIPNSAALVKTGALMHELIGWGFYKYRGWI